MIINNSFTCNNNNNNDDDNNNKLSKGEIFMTSRDQVISFLIQHLTQVKDV
jgi:hypothetical protein